VGGGLYRRSLYASQLDFIYLYRRVVDTAELNSLYYHSLSILNSMLVNRDADLYRLMSYLTQVCTKI